MPALDMLKVIPNCPSRANPASEAGEAGEASIWSLPFVQWPIAQFVLSVLSVPSRDSMGSMPEPRGNSRLDLAWPGLA
jgi:hypothetical protein